VRTPGQERRPEVRTLAAAAVVLTTATTTVRPAAAVVPGGGIIGEAVDGIGGWAFGKVADGIAGWVLGAVSFFVEGAVGFLRTSARPDVEGAWFAGPGSPYATVRNIAGVLLAGFVFLGLIQGLLHGDGAGMVRRMAGNLPLAVAGMVVTTAVAGRLLDLTDAMSDAVLASSDEQALHFLSGFGAAVLVGTGGFAAVVIGLVAVVAALLLWVELIIRASLVYLLVAISPLGFAATLWPAARGFLRKTIEILLAVILSKFVICVALAIGTAALAGAGAAGGAEDGIAEGAGASVGSLMVGAVLLGLAAFAPFIVVKLIPVAEAALVAQGISRSPARAAQTGLSTYSSARMVRRLSGGGGGPSGTGQGGAGPAGGGGGGGGAPGASAGVAKVAGPSAGGGATATKAGSSGAASGPLAVAGLALTAASGATKKVRDSAQQAGGSEAGSNTPKGNR
jgi:hypothetical protein